MSKTPWTEEETAVVIDGLARNLTPTCIAKLLDGRTRSSVKSKIKTLGYCAPLEAEAPSGHYSRHERNKYGDLKFKQAMLDAMRSGFERPPMGVVKDRRPIDRTIFFAAPIFSGCTSSAAYCADLGIDTGHRA